MGALPKRKISKARRDKRRSHNSLTPPALVNCPQCNSPKPPHQVCPVCGTYITADNSIWSGRPGWWILLGLLGILAVVVVLAGISPW